MNQTPTCDTCRFSKHNSDPIDPQTLCVRFPPTPAHGWPTVQIDDWCGEYSKTRPQEGDSNPKDNRLVALVSQYSTHETIDRLQDRKDILQLDRVTGQGTLSNGARFVIVTGERHTIGLNFSNYEVIGKPKDSLVLAVLSRIRPAHPVAVVSGQPISRVQNPLPEWIREYNKHKRTGVLADGRPFIMVYTPDHVHGLAFSDVVPLRNPDPDLIELARIRIRP